MTDWPAWATEHVTLAPPDEEWLHHGERHRWQLDTALSSWLLAPVEHVGSTVVEGLPAKLIRDRRTELEQDVTDVLLAIDPNGQFIEPVALEVLTATRR